MDLLLILIIVAVVAIALMWWYSRKLHSIPDETVIYLNSDEDRVLHPWYKSVVREDEYNFDLRTNEVASEVLRVVYGLEVDPSVLVLGDDLNLQYYHITGRVLPRKCIFYVRETLGVPVQIAIVEDEGIRRRLQSQNEYDANYLNQILRSDVAVVARDYLQQILTVRWNKLRELNLPGIQNDGGSYVYVKDWTVPNVEIASSKLGPRFNLLCSDIEFSNLLKRLAVITDRSE